MIMIFLIPLFLIIALLLWFFFSPIKYFNSLRKSDLVLLPPDFFVYSFVLHIHTQYSFDSLGKPEDVVHAIEDKGIDFAIVTDHDNKEIGKHNHERLIAGREIKINDEEGNLMGNLLEVGDLKVVAHHFREKYRWLLPKDEDLFFELIDLRDSLFSSKVNFTLFVLTGLILMPFLRKSVMENLKRLIDTLGQARRYLMEGWRSRVLGGADHHVILYFRDVKKKFLFPDYRISFGLMRNILLTTKKVHTKEDLIPAIKEGFTLISFSDRYSFVWSEDGYVMATSPYQNTLFILLKEGEIVDKSVGSNYRSQDRLEKGYYMLLGFTYRFRLGRLLVGIRPLFVSDLIGVNQ